MKEPCPMEPEPMAGIFARICNERGLKDWDECDELAESMGGRWGCVNRWSPFGTPQSAGMWVFPDRTKAGKI